MVKPVVIDPALMMRTDNRRLTTWMNNKIIRRMKVSIARQNIDNHPKS